MIKSVGFIALVAFYVVCSSGVVQQEKRNRSRRKWRFRPQGLLSVCEIHRKARRNRDRRRLGRHHADTVHLMNVMAKAYEVPVTVTADGAIR